MIATLDFELPETLEASETPEERGLRRDGVRLLVANRADGALRHLTFADLPSVLEPGDVLAVNTSATLPAALDVETASGQPGRLHLSTQLPAGLWTVELRHPGVPASTTWLDAVAGTLLRLPGGGLAELLVPAGGWHAGETNVRLWIAAIDLPQPLLSYVARFGKPIRYGYVTADRPISAYQTVFADEPGSAEMPSAARPFSAELVTRLVTRGVGFAPFVLHTGVSSLEAHEPPFAERYRVGIDAADRINAVGTTAVRALETVADASGRVHPGQGWTEEIITPERGVRAVDGLITGWHEPRASHLAMLEAIAGRSVLEASYGAALEEGYLWHEFGDSHLILP
jgi:S-adenosylmethionine:tRNA ribosyltransferase-isomerase